MLDRPPRSVRIATGDCLDDLWCGDGRELSTPRTLTIYQLMVVTALIAVACGLATLFHHAYTKTN